MRPIKTKASKWLEFILCSVILVIAVTAYIFITVPEEEERLKDEEGKYIR